MDKVWLRLAIEAVVLALVVWLTISAVQAPAASVTPAPTPIVSPLGGR